MALPTPLDENNGQIKPAFQTVGFAGKPIVRNDRTKIFEAMANLAARRPAEPPVEEKEKPVVRNDSPNRMPKK